MKYDHTKSTVTEAIGTSQKKLDDMFEKVIEVREKEGYTMSMVIEVIEKFDATTAEKIFFSITYGSAISKEREVRSIYKMAHLVYIAIKTDTMTKDEAIKHIKEKIQDPTEADLCIKHLESHLEEGQK